MPLASNVQVTLFADDTTVVVVQKIASKTKFQTELNKYLNIDIIGSQRNFIAYKNLLLSFDLEIQKFEPTRVTHILNTCIGYIIAAEKTQVKTINCTISDHYGLMCNLKIISKSEMYSYQSDFNYDFVLSDDHCLKKFSFR